MATRLANGTSGVVFLPGNEHISHLWKRKIIIFKSVFPETRICDHCSWFRVFSSHEKFTRKKFTSGKKFNPSIQSWRRCPLKSNPEVSQKLLLNPSNHFLLLDPSNRKNHEKSIPQLLRARKNYSGSLQTNISHLVEPPAGFKIH